jgi:predicted permease
MTGLLQDARYALRQLRKSPGFAATAILVLALGLGATTGMLAIVQSVLLNPLNYRDPDRMMLIGISDEATQSSDISYPDLLEMKRSLHQFEDFGAYRAQPLAVQTVDGAQMLVAPAVTTNFFDLLGVRPELGRSFLAGDELGAGSAIVSHDFWQHSMHARQDVVGSTLKIGQRLYSVVGVMPPHFQFPMQTETLWITLQITPEHKTKEGFDHFGVLARLKPRVTLDQARAEGEAFVRNRPGTGEPRSPSHFWLYPYQNLVTGEEKPALLALFGACLLLLIIAVVNTANLQIARATRREVEIAMRAALGATRARILRQLMVESLVLSAAGATLGWLLALGFVKTAAHLFKSYPRFDELRLDAWTFAVCLLLTSFCGVVAALAPAWHVLGRRRNLSLPQNSAGRASRPQRLSGSLVTAEVALTCILLVAAGLFLRTFRSLQNAPLGFVSDRVTSFVIWPQGGDIPLALARAAYQRVLDRLQSMPSVESAGTVTSLPVSNYQITITGGFTIPGHPLPEQRDKPEVRMLAVSPGYFKSMRISLLAGRNILDSDTQSNQLVGVVNHAFVERCLPGVDPLGKQIRLDSDAEFPQPITIIGVSGDVVQGNEIASPIRPELFVSFQQLPASSVLTHFLVAVATSFAVRSNRDLAETAGDIRAVVKSEAPEFAIDDLTPLNEKVQRVLRTRRLAVEITSVFAGVALALSAAGLYGVLAYLIAQRIREIGIRLALGATRENVFVLVARQGLWMVGAGLVFGWLGALVVARWIRSFLFGTSAHDPLTYTLAGALVLFASAIAILLPARRAAFIEPMEALRTE